MTTPAAAPEPGDGGGPPAHEHMMRLVAVDYDDAGHAIREMQCGVCGETSFES